MVSNNAGSFIVRNHLPQTEHLSQRDSNIVNQNRTGGNKIKPKQKCPNRLAEIAKRLKQNYHQEEGQEQRQGIYYALYHPVFVVLADELVQTCYY